MWSLAKQELLDEDHYVKWQGNFFHLQDIMDDILGLYNHKAFVYQDREQVLVLEDKQEVTAVAEIVASSLAYEVVKYNHHTLKGDIEAKKKILLSLGSELEPKRKVLENINKQLSENIFYLLNNLNIRHNNRSKKSKNYKEYVAKMSKNRLETFYDELYQMMLLAFLAIDDIENRRKKINELKRDIDGK